MSPRDPRQRPGSGEDFADDALRFDAREPLVETLKLEREPLVVDPEEMEDGGVEFVHVRGVLDDVVTEVVGLAVRDAPLTPPPPVPPIAASADP